MPQSVVVPELAFLFVCLFVYNAELLLANWDALTKIGFFHLASLYVCFLCIDSSFLNVSLVLHNFPQNHDK